MSVSLALFSSLSVGATVSATGLALAHVSGLSAYNTSRSEGEFDVGPYDKEFSNKVYVSGSECQCISATTIWGARLICIECRGCEKRCMSDHIQCQRCLTKCDNCLCIEQCGQYTCRVPNHPVTKIALGCGILFLATAALAFFFKIFLMCCLNSVGRARGSPEDDTASLDTMDRVVAHRLRDAPPRYDASIGSNNTSLSEHRQPTTPLPDKPPPYNPMPSRGELSLQVATLPDAPPPYSFSYQNAAFASEEPSHGRSSSITSPVTRAPSPLPPRFEPGSGPGPGPGPGPGRELCRTLTM